ncbi:type II toxin-antitoxin system RelE/ParE family toxin [Chitinimonas arctica]|uniref:Type II toxin-antitoxin system RelE/ParE family toxin n=1 Tax=Chitinimonas arctica TaxID=2594795 RepID=A0A516SGT1_9NEIS|nr:type II toxin-antitoxin system RelE/ParE family toxin [Chitinimonas arctica]QDQ27310.1 type II toxin-antitoxin system RelE/ParE family toxin [Chitinimonas arctica]
MNSNKSFVLAQNQAPLIDYDYRAVYTVRYATAVYVLHCFQKKSTSGIATPKPDMELIEARLKAVAAREKG